MRSGAFQGLTEAQAKLRQANMLSDGASVELLDEGDGRFTLVFSFPDLPDTVDPSSRTHTGAAGLWL